jgi:hypothetical protein
VQESNPAIAELLSRPELAPSELSMRLYYFYSTQDQRPLLAGGDGDGDGEAAEVPGDLLESVRQYRAMACLPYDCDTGGRRRGLNGGPQGWCARSKATASPAPAPGWPNSPRHASMPAPPPLSPPTQPPRRPVAGGGAV